MFLIFLDIASGEEETDDDATPHESLELSELNEISIIPLGLSGNDPNFLLLDERKWAFVVTSCISLQQSSTFSCFITQIVFK